MARYVFFCCVISASLFCLANDRPENVLVIHLRSYDDPADRAKATSIIVIPSARRLVDTKRSTTELEALTVEFRRVYTKDLSQILGEQEATKENAEKIFRAARVAGELRLDGCVPALIKVSTLGRGEERRIDDSPKDLSESYPVVWALVQIGKPSVEPLLKVASDPKADELQLFVAGTVLREVEGELAGAVVDLFIRRAQDSKTTKAMLSRDAFTRSWKSTVDQKDQERKK
jgi:hypothetical protein